MKKLFIRALTLVLIATLIAVPTAFAVPESDGVTIQLNGEILEFAHDTPPYFDGVAGKVYVPFRDLFEALGYEVGYEASTRTVFATRIAEIISFNQDISHEITVTRGDVTDTLTMDVPAITSDKGNMLVPVRFVSETIGAAVGWDAMQKTVIIVDTRSLFENDPTEYTLLEKVFKMKLNDEKNYEGKGSVSIDITESGGYYSDSFGTDYFTGSLPGISYFDDGSITLPIDATFDFITGGTGLSGSFTVTADLSDIMGTTIPGLSADYNIDGEIICNIESGLFAIRSDALTSMIDSRLEEGTWLTMDLSELTDMAAQPENTGVEMNVKELVNSLFISIYSEPLNDIDDFEYNMISINIIRGLLGDDGFVKSGNTYTNKMDLSDFGIDGECSLTVTTDNDGNAIGFAASFEVTEYGETITFELSLGLTEMAFNFSMVSDDLSLTLAMDLKLTETAKAPQIQLPAGANTIDISDIA